MTSVGGRARFGHPETDEQDEKVGEKRRRERWMNARIIMKAQNGSPAIPKSTRWWAAALLACQPACCSIFLSRARRPPTPSLNPIPQTSPGRSAIKGPPGCLRQSVGGRPAGRQRPKALRGGGIHEKGPRPGDVTAFSSFAERGGREAPFVLLQ